MGRTVTLPAACAVLFCLAMPAMPGDLPDTAGTCVPLRDPANSNNMSVQWRVDEAEGVNIALLNDLAGSGGGQVVAARLLDGVTQVNMRIYHMMHGEMEVVVRIMPAGHVLGAVDFDVVEGERLVTGIVPYAEVRCDAQ
jgi:hypothetical protein